MGLSRNSTSDLRMGKQFFLPSVWSAKALSRAINHLLEKESWARAELICHAGKRIKLCLPVTQVGFMIDAEGYLQALESIDTLDDVHLTLSIAPNELAEMLASQGEMREKAFKAVKITGDADLAQLIGRLAGQLRWEYEEDLARFIGDAPAHFLVKQGKRLHAAGQAARRDLLGNVVEYLSEEKQVLLKQDDFIQHKAAVNETRDALERLEKRIARLQQGAV